MGNDSMSIPGVPLGAKIVRITTDAAPLLRGEYFLHFTGEIIKSPSNDPAVGGNVSGPLAP